MQSTAKRSETLDSCLLLVVELLSRLFFLKAVVYHSPEVLQVLLLCLLMPLLHYCYWLLVAPQLLLMVLPPWPAIVMRGGNVLSSQCSPKLNRVS